MVSHLTVEQRQLALRLKACGVPEVCLACELQRCFQGQPWYMMIGRVPSPALPDLRPALRMAGPTQSLGCLKER